MSEPEIIGPTEPAFVIEGLRHNRPHTMDAKNLDEAIAMAAWASEDNTWWPQRVKNSDGAIVLDDKALGDAMFEYMRANG